jgi:hypothetical protein
MLKKMFNQMIYLTGIVLMSVLIIGGIFLIGDLFRTVGRILF